MKRETIYIKQDDAWEKDSQQKEKMKKVIKQISSKNCKLIPKYRAKYPRCSSDPHNKKNNEYDNIVIQCIGGVDDNKQKKDHTIIKNIASKVTIPK